MITNFNVGLDAFLTKDQIKKSCPVAFETSPTNPEVSEKYLHVNTETIIDDLAKLGWYPVTAVMRKSRGKETIFSKHMITFQNPGILIVGNDGDDAYPRIILTNSHDGFNSFKFSVGIFRKVCSNGLVIADAKFSAFTIQHKGYTFDELRAVVGQAMHDLPARVEVLNQMKDRVLLPEEKEKLALDSMLIRAGIVPNSEEAEGFDYDYETIDDLLEPRREMDKGDDLWRVFNVLQEKITKGGFKAALKGAKVRKVRAITSFEKDLDVNKKLFMLATSLL